jgi:hypothetical protein
MAVLLASTLALSASALAMMRRCRRRRQGGGAPVLVVGPRAGMARLPRPRAGVQGGARDEMNLVVEAPGAALSLR